MTIKIVTDSTCDLPPTIIAQHGIAVVPVYINIGQESYRDNVDITRQEFYEGLPHYTTFPQTSTPGPGPFLQQYERLVKAGATEILSIHISPSLSNVSNSARIAAETFKAAKVTVIDSRQLSLGVGFAVELAAQAAAAGEPLAHILAAVHDQIERSYVFAALETTEFLRRSGRISGFQNGIGTLLKIKPLLKMYNGNAESERVRTHKKAIQRLISLVQEVSPLEKLAMVHTNHEAGAQKLWQHMRHLVPEISEPLAVNVTPVIGAHIGPGAVGFACIAAK